MLHLSLMSFSPIKITAPSIIQRGFHTNQGPLSHRKLIEMVDKSITNMNPVTAIQREIRTESDGNLSIAGHYLKKNQSIYSFGLGKVWQLNKGLFEATQSRFEKGLCITKTETKLPSRIQTLISSHPHMSELSQDEHPVSQAIQFLQALPEEALLIIALSGGGTALGGYPNHELIEQFGFSNAMRLLAETNKALLESGIDILMKNTVLQHLGILSGGGVTRLSGTKNIIALAMSDVPEFHGDDYTSFSVISSNPVLAPYPLDKVNRLIPELALPDPIKQYLNSKTDQDDHSVYDSVKTKIISSNRTLIDTLCQNLSHVTTKQTPVYESLRGEPEDMAALLAANLEKMSEGSIEVHGGETAPKIPSEKGIGGRNLHTALAFAIAIDGKSGAGLFLGDLHDGNAPVSGVYVDANTVRKAKKLGLDPKKFLDAFDTYTFFYSLDPNCFYRISEENPINVRDIAIIYK